MILRKMPAAVGIMKNGSFGKLYFFFFFPKRWDIKANAPNSSRMPIISSRKLFSNTVVYQNS